MPTRPRYISFRPAAAVKAEKRDQTVGDLAFYSRAPWRRLRARFLSEHPLCEPCLDRDELTPATIAHHKLERLDRPDLALDESNLVAYCNPCHTKLHKAKD